MSRPTTPDHPVPAVVILRLRRARDDAKDFIGLSAALFQAGLIHEAPRELRRLPRTPRVLELTCTFVDRKAARSWRRHRRVRSSLAALAPRLAAAPRLRRYRDVVQDVDRIATCRCRRPSWLVLDPPIPEPGSALVCGDCHERLPAYAIPQRLGDDGWARAYVKVWEIWLASCVLEGWALRELADGRSELNRTAARIARRASRHYGVRVLPRVFTEVDQVRCPRCAREGKVLGWRSLTQCKKCRLVY